MEREKSNFTIHPIPVLTDNIIWILVKRNQAIVVDPSISEPVIKWLKANGITLNSVLQTHHHDDHIGGTKELKRLWPLASVIASKSDIERIPFQTHSVIDNEIFTLLGEEINVIEVPGHTKNHISYYLQPQNQSEQVPPILFCGDTLFGAGCGRLFEGTPLEMFNSLNRINGLHKKTKIYCAH